MQELTSAGRDGEILPRGTAVTKSPEWRGGGPLHSTAFVRDSKGRRRGWSRYERRHGEGPWTRWGMLLCVLGMEEAAGASGREPAQVTIRAPQCTGPWTPVPQPPGG